MMNESCLKHFSLVNYLGFLLCVQFVQHIYFTVETNCVEKNPKQGEKVIQHNHSCFLVISLMMSLSFSDQHVICLILSKKLKKLIIRGIISKVLWNSVPCSGK